MSEVEIEHDIPVAAIQRGGGERHSKYPFADMQVGDSIFAPGEGDEFKRVYERVAKALTYWRKRIPGRFCLRRVDGGVRVWRLE